MEDLKDYSDVKISDVYIPNEDSVVIEQPRLTSKILQIARVKNEAPDKATDYVVTIVAVGENVKKYKVGDKVLVEGFGKPINIIDQDCHSQVFEHQIMGKVIHPEYKEIQKFFSKKNEVHVPIIHKSYLDGNGKIQFDA
jgi:hypothetical protein